MRSIPSRTLAVLAALTAALLLPSAARAAEFTRGDVNFDGEVNLHDAALIAAHAVGGTALPCLDAADVNDDGAIDQDDARSVVAFVYEEGAPPAAPFPAAGDDASADVLTCRDGSENLAVNDDAFLLELEAENVGHRGAVDLHGMLSVPAKVDAIWLRLDLDTSLLARLRVFLDDSVKHPERIVASRLTAGGAEVGILYSPGGEVGPLVGSRHEAFRLRLCLVSPYFSQDIPLVVREVAFSVVGEPSSRVGRAVSPPSPIDVRFGLGDHVTPCQDSPMPPDFLTCETMADGSVHLSWSNPEPYDYLTVYLGVRNGTTVQVTLPGDATSWIQEEGGGANNYVYELRGTVFDRSWSDTASCAAPDPRGQTSFVRGDANSDGRLSAADIITIGRALFAADEPPACIDTADVDDDGQMNLVDQFALMGYLFGMPNGTREVPGDRPPAPFPEPGFDPTHAGESANLSCDEYSVAPPEPTDDSIRLGGLEVVPGEDIRIPIYLSSSVVVDAVQLVVDYDPGYLEVLPGSRTITYEGTYLEPSIGKRFGDEVNFFTYGGPLTWVDPHPEDGVFTTTIIPDTFSRGLFEVPPGEDTLLGWIHARVSPDVPLGTVIALHLREGGDGYGLYRLTNELTHRGEGRFATLLPTVIEGPLHVAVDGDISFFRRGDANDDGRVNISDAVTILGFLFSGAEEPVCHDAADADDSGELELTDAIAILNFLFVGAGEIPAPYPEKGRDPNPDFLPGCRRTTG